MLVTGSRLKAPKNSFGPSVPVDVIDRKQLEQTGISNLPALIQYLTGTQGTGIMGSTNYNNSAGQTAAAINLRGLGAGATLLLLNGRRLGASGAASGGAHFADFSTIPLAAVERVEILRGGASAIYGADAVAGVVNVITRPAWNGARVVAEGQATQSFDHGEFTGSASIGSASPHSRLMLALSHHRRSELRAGERDWPADKYISPLGFPGAFATGGGMLIPDPACGTDQAPNSRLLPSPTGLGNLCGADYRDFFPLINNAERSSLFGSAEFDLTEHTSLFAEALVSHFQSDNVQSPSFPVVAPYPVVPANHIDNPYGETLQFIGAPLGVGTREGRDTADDDSIRGVLGLKGDFEAIAADSLLESWTWEISASWSTSRYREFTADILRQNLQAALDSCSNPAAQDSCFNPFSSALDGTGRPNPSRVVDSILGRQMFLADHTLQTYNAGLSGNLWQLPGGEIGMAFGAELRREWRVTRFDHDANLSRYAFLIGNANAAADRNVYSGYLELRWPLLDGLELQTAGRVEKYSDTVAAASPFAGLTLTPASWIGEAQTPRALRKLQLRASGSRAFRAPTLFNTYPGFATGPQPAIYNGQPLYIPVQFFGNPGLKPETAITLSAGVLWSPLEALNITADFWHYDYRRRIQSEGDPQRFLNNTQSALALMPPGMPDPHVVLSPTGEIAAVRVRSINSVGSLVTSGIDFGVTGTVDGRTFGGGPDDFGQFSLGVQGTWTLRYDVPRANLGNRVLPNGQVLGPADCKGSAQPDLNDDPNDDQSNDRDSCDVLGKRNGSANSDPPALPRLRANLPLGWSYRGHTVTAIAHYISGLEDDVQPLHEDGSFASIPAWLSFDLQYAYALSDVIGKQLSLTVGCLNLFDKRPPTVNGTDPAYAVETHDPRGRMLYAKLGAEF